jgi:hypothetical protein
MAERRWFNLKGFDLAILVLIKQPFSDRAFAGSWIKKVSSHNNELASGMKSRAQVLRAVAEDQELVKAELSRAFVLMQYFGYLRRNPSDLPDSDYTGYDFWLNKLNQFHGDYVAAEMVKAFLNSTEYQARFK